jgi:uncharacterized protein YcaQ
MIKCDKCGYSDNGTGDFAHVCGPVKIKTPELHEEHARFEELMAKDESHLPVSEQSLIFRLRKRAEIRRQITSRKSVQEGAPDRIADLLEEAADALEAAESR